MNHWNEENFGVFIQFFNPLENLRTFVQIVSKLVIDWNWLNISSFHAFRADDPRIEYMRSVSQLSGESDATAGMNTQEDSEEEGDKIQSKKGRGKSKKPKKEKDLLKLGKKGKAPVDRSPPEKRYKCPECSLMFPHVSALYNHASLRHYRQQVTNITDCLWRNCRFSWCFLGL